MGKAENEDNAEIRIDNALERIASTMKRNSEVNIEVKSVLEELEKQTTATFIAPSHGIPLEAIQSIKQRYQ